MSSTDRPTFVSAICLMCLISSFADAAKNDWVEGTPGLHNGATRDYYNRAGSLRWTNFMGDWRDAENAAQGDVPFVMADVADAIDGFVEWDVTALVDQWLKGKHQNQGFFLRAVGGRGTVSFCSRQHKQADHRPQLVLVGANATAKLDAVADTTLNSSTYKCQGQGERLGVSANPTHALLRFDLPKAKQLGEISKVTLRLHVDRKNGSPTIGVFRCAQGHDEPASPPQPGLAAKYPGDQGIESNPDVIFADDFEAPEWNKRWSQASKLEVLDIVAADDDRKFEPLAGKALRVRIAEGAKGAMNTLYKFNKETEHEPEEIYFRYYLRLADDWNQTVQGGKLPGPSGTYGVAGWGGRKSNGRNGWSARGKFSLTIPADNPLAGTTPIGTYCYHADMKGFYGTNWIWQKDYREFLENNRWYAIEQYLKLNTPGENDGVLRAWVDGRLAFEKDDIRFRHIDSLKIEQIWMNVYHGGTKPSPYDQHLFIDNVVIAKKYIGPIANK